MASTSLQVDTDGLQAIVLGNIAGCPLVRHLIFDAPSEAAVRSFASALWPSIRFGANRLADGEAWLLNLSFAAPALQLVLPSEIYDKLETSYRVPPDAAGLGDFGASAPTSTPEGWWEGQFTGDKIGAMVHVHARDSAALEEATERVLAAAATAGVGELVPRRSGGRLDGAYLGPGAGGKGARLHFGFADGLSNSKVAWDGATSADRPIDPRSVVIGHYDDKFPCGPANDPAAALVRDSSYLAFRWIYQDVAAFERFLTDQGPLAFPALSPEAARERLAAKMMGRWRDGTPVVLSPEAPDPALVESDFSFAGDMRGLACPVSAHIRVMNPRGQPLSGMAASSAIPQVVRRGMPYGPELSGSEDDGVDRGIYGMFVCASIRQQFMRLAAWATRNDFSDVFPASGRDQDALIGNRATPGASRRFTIPGTPGAGSVGALPDFIRTKGTQYLMLMSRRTMQQVFALG
jgi:Dyp-type peroxidase family